MASRLNLNKQLPALRKRYQSASRKEKGQILGELEKLTGYHRKHLIALLGVAGLRQRGGKCKRQPRYSQTAIQVLAEIWRRTGQLSSERLHAQLPLLLPFASVQIPSCTPDIEAQLHQISPRQITRRLAGYKRTYWRRKTHHASQRARLVRQAVPISLRRPDDCPPGWLEMDTVAHGGGRTDGIFIWTLNTVDVATGWLSLAPVLGNSASAVVPAIVRILDRSPFPIRAIHSDNGGEFINHHLVSFCHKRHLPFTRSRPCRKNDNPHIEQKNWTAVRQVIGYRRYETKAQLRQLRRIYDYFEIIANLFEPSAKLKDKVRDGARIRRCYDNPQTPLDRLVGEYRKQGKRLSPKIARWVKERKRLDPFRLYAMLDDEIQRLHRLPAHSSLPNTKEQPPCQHAPKTTIPLVASVRI